MKYHKIIVSIFFCIALILITSAASCSREATFKEFVISSEIDDDYHAPLYPRDEYVEGKFKGNIYAVLNAIGVKRDDTFSFKWINNDTNEILFEDKNNYSSQEKGFLKGYFYSVIDTNNIYLKSGKYKVDFYHNNNLKNTIIFNIKSS